MFQRRFIETVKDPVLIRILSFSIVLFFIFLGDAIVSFWVPNLLQDSLGSAKIMGLVIGFSSVAGFILDLIFPQFIKDVTVKRLITWGVTSGMIFAVILLASLKFPLFLIFLFAVAVWGVYYNFLNYSSQQFISDALPLKIRSGGWAIYSSFKSLAYLIGPLLAAWFLLKGEWIPAAIDIFLLTLGLSLVFLIRKVHERPLTIEVSKINLWTEIGHWKVLLGVVWPIVVLSLLTGIIDSAFWTTGTVLTENLTRVNFLGSFFLPLYQLPSLFAGFALAKLSIYKGKKKLAIILVGASSVVLSLLGIADSIVLILFLVFVSALLLSFAYPLMNAVYTDLTARMGRERKHMIGLTDSAVNLSYIFGPIIAGYLADSFGEQKTFSIVGIFVLAVTAVLLIFTPKKLRLPQGEIEDWD